MAAHLEDAAPYRCSDCDRGFRTPQGLAGHRRSCGPPRQPAGEPPAEAQPRKRRRAPSAASATAASAGGDEPPAKKALPPVAEMLKQEGITRSSLEAVAEALRHPLADLTQDCRLMLQTALPWSICPASNDRHKTQQAVVRMIGEVVSSIEAKMTKAVEIETATLAAEERKLTELRALAEQVSGHQAHSSASMDASRTRQLELAADVETRRVVLVERQAEEETVKANLVRIVSDKSQLEAVLAGPFAKLRDGVFEDHEAGQLSQQVQAITPMLTLEQSLFNTLPEALVMRSRGHLEAFAMKQVEEHLRGRIAELDASVQAFAGPLAERQAMTTGAQAQLNETMVAHDGMVAEMVRSMELTARMNSEASTTSDALALVQERVVQAAEDLDKAQAALETFRGFNVRSFDALRSRVSLKPQLELVVHPATGMMAD